MLLPTDNTALRRSLDEWFEATKIHPAVIGEFDDSALLKVFGEAGRALFPAPSAIEREVRKQYNVALVGRADTVRSHFYAVSVERRLRHPAVVAIADVAREKLFG
jgi:LysR family transcriptional activator of nhaA